MYSQCIEYKKRAINNIDSSFSFTSYLTAKGVLSVNEMNDLTYDSKAVFLLIDFYKNVIIKPQNMNIFILKLINGRTTLSY